MSASPPPAELRARILASVARAPAPTRPGALRRQAVAIVAGFMVPLTVSLLLGGPTAGGRPLGYVVALTAAWAGVGLAATWYGFGRGGAMLGRSLQTRALVATLTPLALLATAFVAAMAWPATTEDDATVRSHVVCVVVALFCALGPLAAFAAIRRGSDPVAPRLTGAAIGAASGAWGAVLIELHCGHASGSHVLLGHVLPVALLALVGVLVGDRVLSVRSRG